MRLHVVQDWFALLPCFFMYMYIHVLASFFLLLHISLTCTCILYVCEEICIPYMVCSWCHCHRVHPPMIVVGTDDPSTSASTQLLIFEYSEDTRSVSSQYCALHMPPEISLCDNYVCLHDNIHTRYCIIHRKWQKIHSIVGIVYDPVHDVAFAPNLGR